MSLELQFKQFPFQNLDLDDTVIINEVCAEEDYHSKCSVSSQKDEHRVGA